MSHVKYFWDEEEDNVVRTYDEDNHTLTHYTTEPSRFGAVLCERQADTSRIYHFDGLGNSTELTDETGNVIATRRFSAFGEPTESTGLPWFLFQWEGSLGYQRSVDSERLYVRRRDLTPAYGRWYSSDPRSNTPLAGEYSYATRSPASRVDPSGLVCYSNSVYEKASECTTTANTFLWSINWVSQPFDNGLLVQRVSMTGAYVDCHCKTAFLTKKCNQATHETPYLERPLSETEKANVKHGTFPLGEEFAYWEVWVVKNGKVGRRTASVGQPVGPNTKYGAADNVDVFSLGSIGASRGDAVQRGNVYFIPISGDPEDGFATNHWTGWRGFNVSAGLPTRCADEWSLPPNATAVMNRSISVRWSCCESDGSPNRFLFVFPPVESGGRCSSSPLAEDLIFGG